jgi:ferredoxin
MDTKVRRTAFPAFGQRAPPPPAPDRPPWQGGISFRKDRNAMTHTVCQPCYDCKYTDCVAVCPVECFYQDDKMLYIDPADCIDCEACVPECPVEAIFAEANVPAQWTSFTQVNADKSTALKDSGEGHITEKQDAQEGAECKKK